MQLDHRLFERYRYGIVDAERRADISDSWAQEIIAPSFLGADTSRSPVLVRTDTLSDEHRAELLGMLEDETNGRRATFFSLLLDTDANPHRIANHLAKRLVVQLEQDERPMQFRYFDPGTFVQLPGLLGDAGMNWLLGPIHAVMAPWAGESRRYEKPDSAKAAFSLKPHLPSLLDCSIVNRAAMRLDPPADQAAWTECCERIRRHVQRARERYRLVKRDDLAAFAVHAENCHPRFDEHKIMSALLDQLAEASEDDELDYCELIFGLRPETWKQIAHDLKQNESTERMPS